MTPGEVIDPLFKAALPIGLMSFAIYFYLGIKGRISNSLGLRELQQDARLNVANREVRKKLNYFERKWFRFGTGYYGVVALLTFLLFEFQDAHWLVTTEGALTEVMDNLGIGTAVQFFINQIMNVAKAFAWPGYWLDDIRGKDIPLWFGISYGGYLAGIFAARFSSHRVLSKP